MPCINLPCLFSPYFASLYFTLPRLALPYLIRFHRVFFCVITTLNIIEASYKVTMFENKDLHGCKFQGTSETTIGNCLARCLENCKCRSFRRCNGEETCSLCLSNLTSLTIKEGCGYFALERSTPQVG